MSDNGWRRRRRVTRRGGGSVIEEARAVVEAWRAAPLEARAGLPPWLEDSGDAPGIGRFIDHTLLKPEVGRDAILALCDEAAGYGLRAVCVNGCWVGDCVSRLDRSGVGVATVVGFPLGAAATKAKVAEARLAVGAGAGELGMVMAIGQARSGEWRYVEDDIRRVVDAAGSAPVKVILETAALEPVEIAAGCLVARAAGAAWVMTSTGFHAAGGATEGTVSLLRRAVGFDLGVEASGGIRTAESALRMLAAGADRIETSGAAAMAALLGPFAPPLTRLLELGASPAPEGGQSPAASGY
jgi:deoxyribose-phosphate aldolase